MRLWTIIRVIDEIIIVGVVVNISQITILIAEIIAVIVGIIVVKKVVCKATAVLPIIFS